eukprot:gene38089-46282_t
MVCSTRILLPICTLLLLSSSAFAFTRCLGGKLVISKPKWRGVKPFVSSVSNESDDSKYSSASDSPGKLIVRSEDPQYSYEKLAILLVYFVQGALGLSRLAVTFFLKDQLGLSPAESSALLGITSFPWIIKPVYGFISDTIPLFGYKRRSYLMLSGVLGCGAWLAMATLVHDSTSLLIAITLSSLSIAFSDVVVDSIVVERSKALPVAECPGGQSLDTNDSSENNTRTRTSSTSSMGDLVVAGDLQSQCWAASAIGGVLSAYFSGSLLEKVPVQTVFLSTAVFPLLISLASL